MIGTSNTTTACTGRVGHRANAAYNLFQDGIEIEALGAAGADIAQPGGTSPQPLVLPSGPVGFLHCPVPATDDIFLRYFIAIVSSITNTSRKR